MKALVKFAKGREGMELRDVPIPQPREGEVRIAIKAVGICGSDLHSMLDKRETVMPVILGHEFAGVVEKTCGDTCGLKVGDWVTGLPACYSCGHCTHCLQGDVSLCRERGSVGTHKDGAMAEYMVMPAKFCYKIPEAVEDKLTYAAAEPLTCAVRGVYEMIHVKPGDVAVVSGPGTIGLFLMQALKSRGAYVIVSGLPQDHHRLQKALELGADAVAEGYNALREAVTTRNPEGADIVCEASGAAPSLKNCLNIIKTHGTLLQVGVYSGPIEADINQILVKELTVVGTNSTAVSSWKVALRLLQEGKLRIDPIISLRLPLAEWKRGFDAALDKSAFKILLIP